MKTLIILITVLFLVNYVINYKGAYKGKHTYQIIKGLLIVVALAGAFIMENSVDAVAKDYEKTAEELREKPIYIGVCKTCNETYYCGTKDGLIHHVETADHEMTITKTNNYFFERISEKGFVGKVLDEHNMLNYIPYK